MFKAYFLVVLREKKVIGKTIVIVVVFNLKVFFSHSCQRFSAYKYLLANYGFTFCNNS